MPLSANLVAQKSVSIGDGNFVLQEISGYRSFIEAFPSNSIESPFYYFIRHKTLDQWEVGTGHLSAGELVRDTVLESSNLNAKVVFSAGAKEIMNDIPASLQEKLSKSEITFPFVYNSGNANLSLLNFNPPSVGTLVSGLQYYPDMENHYGTKIRGQSVWEAFELTGGSPDNTSFDNSNGFVVQGEFAKFRLVQPSRVDLSSVGIFTDGETLGQSSRLTRILNAASISRSIIEGQGTLMIDATLNNYYSNKSEFAFLGLENCRLLAIPSYFGYMAQVRGGGARDAGRIEAQAWGTPQGAWGIYSKSVKQSIIQSVDIAADTITDAAHGQADGTLVRFESRYSGRPNAGSGNIGGISSGSWYRIKNSTTDTYQLGTLADNTTVDLNEVPAGTITAYYGGKRIVTASVASPSVINDPAHGLTTGDYKAFYATTTMPTGMTSGRYYKIVVLDANTYTLKSILDDTIINVTVAAVGTLTADGAELEWQNVNEGTVGFRVNSSASGSCSFKLHASYCGTGVVLDGGTEKERIEIHAVGCDEICTEIATAVGTVTFDSATNKVLWTGNNLATDFNVKFGGASGVLPEEIVRGRRYKVINRTANDFQITEMGNNTVKTFASNGSGTIQCLAEVGTTGGSSDTNKIDIIGTRCRRLYTHGPDNTSRVEINFESPIDLGRKIITTDGAVLADPRILIMDGKRAHLSGHLRTHNGSLYILIDRIGSSALDGTDSCHIDNVAFTDNCYGTLLFARRVQRLTGRLFSRHSHNARVNTNDTGAASNIGNIPCPTVWLGQVYGGDFGVSLINNDSREGLRIGDATYNLYPRDWNMGRNTIIMSTFNPRTGVYPLTMNALVVEKMVGGSIPFDQIEGNIRLEAGCSGVRIEVPSIWATRYNLSTDLAATALISIRGSISFNEIAYKPWLRNGIDVTVESLSDYGGAPARYRNGKWEIVGYPLTGLPSDFASISNSLNQIFKRKGLTAYDGSRLLVASGDAAADPWTYFDGSNGNTIGYQAATAALVARMATAPSVVRQLVYDRLYYDLSQAGLMSGKLIALYILGAHEEATALLNLISTSYNLTKNGSPLFTANAGFTGTGNTADFLATGFTATVTPEGMGQNDAHSGVFGLTNATSAAGDILGSANGRMSIKIASGGSSYAKTTTTSSLAITSPLALPRHVLGNRVVSNSQTIWENGVLVNTGANNSNGLPDAVSILKGSTGATLGQAFAAHIGKGLTGTEVNALYQALGKCYNGILSTV